MRLHLITVGTPKLSYAQVGWEEYETRLKRYHKVQVSRVNGKTPQAEGESILRAARRAPLILLDPRGRQLSSEELSEYLAQQALAGQGELAFAVGGPEGHSEELRLSAQWLWSLGRLTLPHDLAMLVMIEALYRASSINAGSPYHRGS